MTMALVFVKINILVNIVLFRQLTMVNAPAQLVLGMGVV